MNGFWTSLLDFFTLGGHSERRLQRDERKAQKSLNHSIMRERIQRQADSGFRHTPYSARCQDGGGEIRLCVMCETKWPCRYEKAERALDRIIKANKQLKPNKETTMRVIDISPAMIGKIIRIDRPGIVGTHNHIEGELEDFSIEIDEISNLAGGIWRRTVTGITATIAGLDLQLTGLEPLTLTS